MNNQYTQEELDAIDRYMELVKDPYHRPDNPMMADWRFMRRLDGILSVCWYWPNGTIRPET